MKPYKVLKTHQIKETNFGLRVTFGVWCLSNIETAADFTSRVIFSDEKWWVLDSSPNSQTDRRWSLVNPREYAECKYQGKKKVMCWMGFLQGAVLGPFWFVDEQQRPITLNQFSYLNMLEHDLWPVLRERRNLRRIWFMQDGATCHMSHKDYKAVLLKTADTFSIVYKTILSDIQISATYLSCAEKIVYLSLLKKKL